MTSGWQTKPIGEVFRVVNGGTPKTGVAEYWGGAHAWITPAEMGSRETPYIASSRRTLTDDGLRVGAELVPAGSIILSTRAPIGHIVINDVPMAFNQGCKGLVPSAVIDAKFAYYFFRANVQLLESLGTGATFKELSGAKLKEILISFPSLAEQQRVVKILDEALAAIDTAKANAANSLQSARGLLRLRLNEIFTDRGDSWRELPLAELCTLINGRAYKKEEMLREGKYPLLRVGNFFTSNEWYYSDLELEGDKYCDQGDLMYAWSASFGPRIWTGGKTIYHYHIWKVLPRATIVTKEFLFYVLEWDVEQIKEQHGTGTTMLHVSKGSMESRVVPVPPLKSQAEIVLHLDGVKAHTAQLEAVYRAKLAALDELAECLLRRAFAGQL